MRRFIIFSALLAVYLVTSPMAHTTAPYSLDSPVGGCEGIVAGADLGSILRQALGVAAPDKKVNGGLGNHVWATVVDRFGIVCAVTHTGKLGDQWLGSRMISAQKATTAVLFSLPAAAGGTIDAMSTANLWTSQQPGGGVLGLQLANAAQPQAVGGGNGMATGVQLPFDAGDDPLVGHAVAGTNVFGGGLALYDDDGNLIGGIGISGDTACADHNVAWRVRHELALDKLRSGNVIGLGNVLELDPDRPDNIIYDITPVSGESASGFGHPRCGFGEEAAAMDLPAVR